MTDRATLEALLNRVLEGTGPDRELDAEIHAATLHIKPITPEAVVMRECQENGFYALHHVPGSPGGVSYWHQAPHYTESLDAALTVFFGNPPPLIPSEPRLVLREALRERMEAQPLSNP